MNSRPLLATIAFLGIVALAAGGAAAPRLLAAISRAPGASASGVDVDPPIVDHAVAVGFAVTPAKTFNLGTTKIDVYFDEPVDPVTSQTAGNYAYSGPVARTVLSAVQDVGQPELVHLTLNLAVGPSSTFHNITVTGVQDLATNTIVANGNTNVGSFNIQSLSFQGRMKKPLCDGLFLPGDSIFVEGDLAPLTLSLGDNARLTDPNVDSVYTGLVPMSLPKDRVTGKAEADLSWNFGHGPTAPPIEPILPRTVHLSSDNGATMIITGAWANEPSVCLTPATFTFGQLDFQSDFGLAPNSDIGECRFTYITPHERGFLNVAVKLPEASTPTWVVRNVFMPDSGLASPVENMVVRFPLSHLGVVQGQFVSSLHYSFRLTATPLGDADTTQWFSTLIWHGPATLDHPLVREQGYVDVSLVPPGPVGSQGWHYPTIGANDTAKVAAVPGCNMPNIDLDSLTNPGRDKNGCGPAGCANSLKWLDTTNVAIALPGLRKLYEQLSDLMCRDSLERPVGCSTLVVAKLDLIEAYKLPLKVKFEHAGVLKNLKSTSGLTSAITRDTILSWPSWGFLEAEVKDGEDVELGGLFHYVSNNQWVPAGWGHVVAVTGAGTTGGKPWLNFKHDRDQIKAGGTAQEETKPETTNVIVIPGPKMPVVQGGPPVQTYLFVDGIISESYDANAAAAHIPAQDTMDGYCDEIRRTIPPKTKLTITYPTGQRCFNSTLNVLDRSTGQPVWHKQPVWNKNSGLTRQYVNNTDKCITIAIHNDDPLGIFGTSGGPIILGLSTTPVPGAQERLERIADDTTPGNPDDWGGFSLGGTSGGPDEFGSPVGPAVTLDASSGCVLDSVPGRMGAGVQQLTLNHPIPVWNPYWGSLGLYLTISTVHSPGNLQIDCPSSGYSGSIFISGPGSYEVNLGTVAPTSLFTITMTTTGGLDLEFDAIGVPSIVPFGVGVDDAAVPRVAGLWNLGPSPSRHGVTLRLDLPRRERVELAVFDVAGRRVSTIVSGVVEPGIHRRQWSAEDDARRPVPSGVYFCRMTVAGQSWTARIVIER